MSRRPSGLESEQGQRIRLQIPLTAQQRQILQGAADRARCDLNTWSLAHLIRAAKAQESSGSPLVVGGRVADRIRQLSAEQGITTDSELEQLLASLEA